MKNSIHPKLVVLIVYKTSDDYYRGFCSPYNVTCEGKTQKDTMEVLQDMVTVYEKSLKKYNYPKHLTFVNLSDEEDRKVFDIALKAVSNDLKKNLTERYAEFQQKREVETFKLQNIPSRGYYYLSPNRFQQVFT